MHVHVSLLSGTDGVSQDADARIRDTVAVVLPEFKAPSQKLQEAGHTAVAGEEEWEWGKGAEETMHPF